MDRYGIAFLLVLVGAACKPEHKQVNAPTQSASAPEARAPAEPGSDVGDCCCVDSKDPQAGTLYTGAKAAARCQRENGTCVVEFGDIDACVEAANQGTGVPAGD